MKRFKVGDKALVTDWPSWNGSVVTITRVYDDNDDYDYEVSREIPEGVIDYTTASIDDSELTPMGGDVQP